MREMPTGNAMTQQNAPTMVLLIKLGAIAVHADELISVDGREVDKLVLQGLLDDPEVREWIRSMGPLLPVKRLSDAARKAIEDIRGQR